MSEIYEGTVLNPYGVMPAASVSMTQNAGHGTGNALAANAEARVVAEVKAQVLMSKQFPRDPHQAAERILAECQRPSFADTATYTYQRGKETVSGPSIRLAEVLARHWGNCTFGLEVLERKTGNNKGPGSSTVRAYSWDLETNTYISRQFEVKHFRSTKSGGYALNDDRDIYELEANMGSRRMRACILQMIPGDIVTMAVAACRKTASSTIAEMMRTAEQREKIIALTIKAYEKFGIRKEDLEEYLSSKASDWNADSMLKLKELKNGIDEGVTNIGDVFPHLAPHEKNETISKEQVKELMEAAKATGQQGKISDELKKIGIAKFADVPADKYSDVLSMINSLKPAEEIAFPTETGKQERK